MPIEMMRSGDLYDAATTKQTRVLDKHKVLANPGPTSSNPGPWLTGIFLAETFFPDSYKDHNESQELSEGYLSACLVRESYLFRPRERRLRIPLQTDLDHDDLLVPSPTFDDLPPELETRSFCKVTQMDRATLYPHEHTPGFKVLEQPNVLSGPDLLKWRAEHFTAEDLKALAKVHRDEEREARKDRDRDSDEKREKREAEELYESERKAEAKRFGLLRDDRLKERKPKKKKSKEPMPPKRPHANTQLGSTEMLNAHYAVWISRPCELTRNKFHETLHHFLCCKSELKTENDTIRKMGLTEDFQTDFLFYIIKVLDRKLDAGKILDYPAAYITTAWDTKRTNKFKELRAKRKIEQSLDLPQDTSNESDTDESDLTRIDLQRHKDWSRGAERYSLTEPDTEQVREARLAAIDKLSPDQRDLVWMRLQGHTQAQIAAFLKISQPAVHKRMKQAEAKLAALEAEAA